MRNCCYCPRRCARRGEAVAASRGVPVRQKSIKAFPQGDGGSGAGELGWNSAQAAYWDAITNIYDGLYEDQWSALENQSVVERLQSVVLGATPRILDLGCGTGLGRQLTERAIGDVEYYGRDISQMMLDRCAAKYPDAVLSHGAMTDLSPLPSEHFDVVT
jgi:SAM-dependent methyltransferase